MRNALTVAACLCASVVAAQTAQPPVPAVSTAPSFGEERDGRRLLVRARERLLSADGLALTARWSAGGATGVETLTVAPGRKRFDLLLETGVGDARSVRRAILAEGRLRALRYDARPVRREMRSVSEALVGSTWGAALSAMEVEPRSRALVLAVTGAPVSGQVWQTADGSVLETPFGARRLNDPVRTRRWRFAADGLPTRIEEWTTVRGRGGREQTTYRSETYAPAGKRSDLYAQTVPPGYVERPAPNLPAVRSAAVEIDAKSRALLDRWRTVFERPLAIQATVAAVAAPEPRSESSRAFGRRFQAAEWRVWLRRPGRGRAEGERRGMAMSAITDGERARGRREARVGNPEDLWSALASVGVDDGNTQLDWFFDGPPRLDDYESVRYVGRGRLDDGTEVDVIEALWTRRQQQANARGATTTVRLQIGFAADGFPRQFEIRRRTDNDLTNEADQPPDFVRTIAWRNLMLDAETPADTFSLR